MVRRREKIEIVEEILQLASNREGIGITRLVYGVNTNFRRIQDYLSKIVDEGLVTCEDGRYFITIKGIDTMRQLELVLKLTI